MASPIPISNSARLVRDGGCRRRRARQVRSRRPNVSKRPRKTTCLNQRAVPRCLNQRAVPRCLNQPALPRCLNQRALPRCLNQWAVPRCLDQRAVSRFPRARNKGRLTLSHLWRSSGLRPLNNGAMADLARAGLVPIGIIRRLFCWPASSMERRRAAAS